jgi:hypothetical protein
VDRIEDVEIDVRELAGADDSVAALVGIDTPAAAAGRTARGVSAAVEDDADDLGQLTRGDLQVAVAVAEATGGGVGDKTAHGVGAAGKQRCKTYNDENPCQTVNHL